MTISELVDFIDVNRDSNDEYIEIVGPNNSVTATIKTSSDVLYAIENWKIAEIGATGKGVIRVWLVEK